MAGGDVGGGGGNVEFFQVSSNKVYINVSLATIWSTTLEELTFSVIASLAI